MGQGKTMRYSVATVNKKQTLPRKIWKYGWGLAFVCAMTLLAEFGERSTHQSAASVTTSSSLSASGGTATSTAR
jgi:hypothetical protein